MGFERPKREELPALQEPETSQPLTVRSVPLSQLLMPPWPLPAFMKMQKLAALGYLLRSPCTCFLRDQTGKSRKSKAPYGLFGN